MPKPPSFKNLQWLDGRADRSDDGEQTADALHAKTESGTKNMFQRFLWCFVVMSGLDNLGNKILGL